MALFGKLFEKKECAICGGEIGLLGNRKLEDGNMCKECAKKLSPWFDDRRHSTIEQINEQLAYREANKQRVASFRASRTFGEGYTKLFLDESAGAFMVSSADSPNEWREANPDVIDLANVTSCELEIDEDRTEIMRKDREGKDVSYNPPRYTYSYDFYIQLHVRSPYFDDIRFQINRSSVELEGQDMQRSLGGGMRQSRPAMGINPEYSMEYRNYKMMGEEIKAALLRLPSPMGGQYGQQSMQGQYGQQPMMGNQFGQQPMQGQYGQQPMMGNQFGQQPMQGQYGQQPMMGNQFGQQPMQGQYGQQPMQGQFGQQPMMGNQFGQQPMQGQYGQQPMQGQFGQQPMQGQYGQQPMNNQFGAVAAGAATVASSGVCPSCGASGQSGGAFCEFCGARLK